MPHNKLHDALGISPPVANPDPEGEPEDGGFPEDIVGLFNQVREHLASVQAERERVLEELNVQTGTPPLVTLPGAGAVPSLGQRLTNALRGVKAPNVGAGPAPTLAESVAIRGQRILSRLFGTALGQPPAGGIERAAQLHNLLLAGVRTLGRDQIEDLRERVLANIERMQAGNGDDGR